MPDAFEGALAFRIVSVSDEATTGEMEIAPGMLNPFGTVHAGALIWFADVCATRHVFGPGEVTPGLESFPVAVTLNAQLLSNRSEGTLTATSRWVKKGRRVSTVRTVVTGPDDRELLDLTSTHISAR